MQTTSNYGLKKPENTDPVNIQDFNDNADVIDAALKKKLESESSASDMTTAFSQASSRTNLVSEEAVKTSFGKIMKWFADLKGAAFAAIANNLTTNTAGSVLDATQGKVLDDKITVINSSLVSFESESTAKLLTILAAMKNESETVVSAWYPASDYPDTTNGFWVVRIVRGTSVGYSKLDATYHNGNNTIIRKWHGTYAPDTGIIAWFEISSIAWVDIDTSGWTLQSTVTLNSAKYNLATKEVWIQLSVSSAPNITDIISNLQTIYRPSTETLVHNAAMGYWVSTITSTSTMFRASAAIGANGNIQFRYPLNTTAYSIVANLRYVVS